MASTHRRTNDSSHARQARWALALSLALAATVAWLGSGSAQDAGAPASAQVDSVRQLEIAVEKDPDDYEKLYRLGIAYLDRDRSDEAIKTFQRCTELKPAEARAWVNLGAAWDAHGRDHNARVAYRKALEIRENDEIALCRLAASLYANNLRAESMDTLRLALERHPRSYCAYFTLGVAFADAQIYHEAIRSWEKVVEIAPETPEGLAAKESIETLRSLMQMP